MAEIIQQQVSELSRDEAWGKDGVISALAHLSHVENIQDSSPICIITFIPKPNGTQRET
jgi:hypothetical protein